MEDGQSDHAANKLEIVQMFRVDAGMRVNLQGVVVVCRVLEETIERVKHFVGEEEEEFTAEVSNDTFNTVNGSIKEKTYRERPP